MHMLLGIVVIVSAILYPIISSLLSDKAIKNAEKCIGCRRSKLYQVRGKTRAMSPRLKELKFVDGKCYKCRKKGDK